MALILLLGPDRERGAGIRSLLRQDGHQVSWLRSVDGWRRRESELQPELVIAAVGSTEGLFAPPTRTAAGFPPPLLFIQQEADFMREVHVEERLVDRLASPFMSAELLGRVDALIRVRRMIRRRPEDALPGALGESERDDTRGLGQRLRSWLRARLPQDERPLGPYREVAARVADWVDRRDTFEPGHAERVASLCDLMAEGLGFDEDETSVLLRAAMLHDIGKVALPVEVLHQKGPLEESQRRLIRTHPARGAALLRALDPDEQVARAVLYHHERPDGGGYYCKEADGVPRAASVLAVAEAYDAMTTTRLRERLSPEAALDRLRAGRGEAYDAEGVDALDELLRPRAACLPLTPQSR